MGDLDEFRATYFDECSELIVELEDQFAAIGAGDRGVERQQAVFRAVHSIKGGAGAFGLTALVTFTHAFETLLDHIRSGALELTGEVIALCQRATDVTSDFISAARDGRSLPHDHGDAERTAFEALTSGTADLADTVFDIDFTPVRAVIGEAGSQDTFEAPPLQPAAGRWEIRFRPTGEFFARANDPQLLLRELATLGEIAVRANVDPLPALADFEPFGIYCAWEATLTSGTATEQDIAEVFEFVEGLCELTVVRLDQHEAASAPALPSFEDLLAAEEADRMPSAPQTVPVIEAAAPSPVEAMAAPAAGETAAHEPRGPLQSIRVDLEKVDRVVNMVGELVIAQSMLTQQMDDTLRQGYQELVRGLEVLAQTTRGLQDSVMAIRALPVKSVFSRMPRLVRELAQATGKTLKLETSGEATEIDKTVIEHIGDPITHMIRNSADHGIESPQQRRARGKPEAGTIRLSAQQVGGSIVVSVEDDGAGIDRQRVLEIARQRMLVGPGQQLSDEQIDNLIFAAGFSTATTVSDISGRGVGMDIVLSNIKRLGGSVHVTSTPGRGTRITMRLPLTLAVLEVMLVRVAGNPYVIPLSTIVETLQCARADFGRAPSGATLLRVRGRYVHVVDLQERFGMHGDVPMEKRFVVLCEGDGNVPIGVVVDDIIGQQQVVIKSLEQNFESVDGIAGGTILGDGSVALIVDVQGLRQAGAGSRQAA